MILARLLAIVPPTDAGLKAALEWRVLAKPDRYAVVTHRQSRGKQKPAEAG